MPSKAEILHYTVGEVIPYINWIYYFHAWGMEPRFAAVAHIHDCPACRAAWIASFAPEEQPKAREAMKLYDEATRQLQQWANEPMCHALFLLAPAYSKGDDIIVNNEVRLPFLRQQHVGKEGYTMCLSDFISPTPPLPERHTADIAHTIGVFATTVSEPSEQPSTDNTECIPSVQLSTLTDRLTEATAEKLHEEVRKHYWGYAQGEQLSMKELHDEKFQGIRPAVGYPSLPDQSVNFLIDQLLCLADIGISLSGNGAMYPHCSVSGLMLAHPHAHYFAIGEIGEDQLADYAQRRGIEIDTIKKYLAKNI